MRAPAQVYKTKHLGMQTASTNISERMGRSQELSEFQRGTVMACHLCNESGRWCKALPLDSRAMEMSSLE